MKKYVFLYLETEIGMTRDLDLDLLSVLCRPGLRAFNFAWLGAYRIRKKIN